MSTRKAREGLVILSFLSVNSNQAPHSRPPPPTVEEFVRFGLLISFLAKISGSSDHLQYGWNCQVFRTGLLVAFEGWI
jgi:hypothetical protein